MNKLFFKYQGFLSHPCDSLNVISCHKSLFQKHTNTNTGFFVHHLDLCIRLHHPSRQSGEEESFLTQILPRTPVQQQVFCLFVPGELSQNLIWNSTSKWIIFRTVRLKAKTSQALIGKGRGKSHSILLFLSHI